MVMGIRINLLEVLNNVGKYEGKEYELVKLGDSYDIGISEGMKFKLKGVEEESSDNTGTVMELKLEVGKYEEHNRKYMQGEYYNAETGDYSLTWEESYDYPVVDDNGEKVYSLYVMKEEKYYTEGYEFELSGVTEEKVDEEGQKVEEPLENYYGEVRDLVGKTVKFTKVGDYLEVEFDSGMVGDIIQGYYEEYDKEKILRLVIDFKPYEKYNEAYMSSDYYNKDGDAVLKLKDTPYYNKGKLELNVSVNDSSETTIKILTKTEKLKYQDNIM